MTDLGIPHHPSQLTDRKSNDLYRDGLGWNEWGEKGEEKGGMEGDHGEVDEAP